MRKSDPDETAGETSPTRGRGGVQSLERAFLLLEEMADAGGIIGLSQLAERSELPLATIHRLIRSLVDLGYVRQESNRQYSLGPRLLRLAAESATRIGTIADPLLTAAVAELGESVNLALLDGDEIVYVAQSQPRGNLMRMFTEVGRRTHPHSTAVGKAILAQRPDAEITALLSRTGMPSHTPTTLTTPEDFLQVIDRVREVGHATDEGEQEVGVRCVAVAVPGAPRPMGLSMSGPTTRMDDATVDRGARVLHRVAAQLADELRGGTVLLG